MKAFWFALVAISALVAACLPSAAATIHVPDDQPTIQAGIDAASYGDTVIVACGTYYEHSVTMKSGVYLTSETGLADCVTIDAQQLGRVVSCDGIDSTTAIVGFTLAGGDAAEGVIWPSRCGGGLCCTASSPTVTNCAISGNTARDSGGGLFCNDSSSPTLTDCVISFNAAVFGAGVYCHDYSSPTLENCILSDNIVPADGGGGGAFLYGHCSPVLTNCTVSRNTAAVEGGGIACHNWSSPTLAYCTLSGNTAGMVGGGLYCGDMFPSTAVLTNCIIAFSEHGEAVYCGYESSATLTCCDIYGNEGGDWVGCIADQYGANGNISEDPLFCGDLNPDEPYTLHANSPCSPESNPGCGLIGAWGVGCGLTPVQAASWGAIKAMFR